MGFVAISDISARQMNNVVPKYGGGRRSQHMKFRPQGKFLGPVDGFDQDEGSGECDEGAEVCGGLFAAQGDAFEAFDLNGMTDNGLN